MRRRLVITEDDLPAMRPRLTILPEDLGAAEASSPELESRVVLRQRVPHSPPEARSAAIHRPDVH